MTKEHQKTYKETLKGKETERVYRLKNRSKIREYHKEWVKKNKDKVKNNSKRGYEKLMSNGKVLVEAKTRRKYGNLKDGFLYHHNTIPYNVDKFIILENKMHLWYHMNISRLVKNKKAFGIYNPSRDDIRQIII